MKKAILISFFILLTSIVFGQSINDLDARNGFKTIKLGSDISDFKDKIGPVSGEKDGVIMYIYSPSDVDLKTVFDSKFDNIYLIFKNSKLIGIQLKKKFSDFIPAVEEIKLITKNFIQLFGNYNSTINESSPTKVGFIWAGKIVLLQAYTNRLGLDKGSENVIDIVDINYADSKLKNGF